MTFSHEIILTRKYQLFWYILGTFEFLIDEHVRLFIFKKKSHLGIFIRDCAFIYFDKEKFRQGKTLHLNASNESEIVIFRKYFTLI